MIKESSHKGIPGYHMLTFLELEADNYYKSGGIESVREQGLQRLDSLSKKFDKLGDDLKSYLKKWIELKT